MTEDTAQAQQAEQAQTAPAETAEEPFDKERAMALITKLRDEVKDRAQLQKRLDAIEAERKAAAEKDMTEIERIKAQLAETAKAAQDAQEKLTGERRRSLVVTVASRMGANDPQDANILQAVASIDPSAAEAETQVKQTLDALAKAKPYLFKVAGQASFNPAGSGTETDRQRLDRIYRLTGQATSPFG